MPTKNLVITDHQSRWVEALVQSGRYQNASEVMREGLRLLERQERDFETRLQALKAEVQLGVDDLAAGRFTSFDTAADAANYLRERGQRRIKRKEPAAEAGK